MIALSGMDGMVGAIRERLDGVGFSHVPIMSYAAKYASAFYGPFREAAESTPQFGDRRGYQMDPAAGAAQALREVELDLAEGADIVWSNRPWPIWTSPQRSRAFSRCAAGAYNVSGEFSMIKAAAEKGWIDERATALETLLAMRRAGAGILLTYWAKDAARWLA
jgi:porphobilinogen synthase